MHKSLKGGSNFVTSYNILKNANYDIILLESVNCNSKDELHMKERHYIETLNCFNKYIVGRTHKEYYKDNIEQIKDKQKEYKERDNKIQKKDRERQRTGCVQTEQKRER